MVSRIAMTIHIPDDLARGLEGLAAAQEKSVEQRDSPDDKVLSRRLRL
jgi:hypothetical protein